MVTSPDVPPDAPDIPPDVPPDIPDVPADVPPDTPPHLSTRLDALLRAARRRADLSQRQLALLADVPLSTVSRMESEHGADPRLRTLERCLAAMQLRLAVVTLPGDGCELLPLPGDGELRDGGDRRYPPHVDLRPVKTANDWSGAWWDYDIPRDKWPVKPPDHTFDLRRALRDRKRDGDLAEPYNHIDVDENEP